MQFDNFLSWAKRFFGEDNIVVKSPEIMINSPFVDKSTPDSGKHCWCNPDKNAYHCFKTDAHGSLYKLVMEMEGCDYSDAIDIVGRDYDLIDLEKKIELLFNNKKIKSKKMSIQLPKDTFLISSMRKGYWRQQAEEYILRRKLPIDGLYFCISGEYKNRIVIPYFNKEGELIYFNSRDITSKSKLRYKGPDKTSGVGKSDVLWMSSWPKAGEKIYLTEGEFDAMSLKYIGLYGGACGGKNLTEKQLLMLSDYSITLCFDKDLAGRGATYKSLSEFGVNRHAGLVVPAEGYKDWNEMLVKLGPNVLKAYVEKYEKPLASNILWYEQ
jgi:DNA primase